MKSIFTLLGSLALAALCADLNNDFAVVEEVTPEQREFRHLIMFVHPDSASSADKKLVYNTVKQDQSAWSVLAESGPNGINWYNRISRKIKPELSDKMRCLYMQQAFFMKQKEAINFIVDFYDKDDTGKALFKSSDFIFEFLKAEPLQALLQYGHFLDVSFDADRFSEDQSRVLINMVQLALCVLDGMYHSAAVVVKLALLAATRVPATKFEDPRAAWTEYCITKVMEAPTRLMGVALMRKFSLLNSQFWHETGKEDNEELLEYTKYSLVDLINCLKSADCEDYKELNAMVADEKSIVFRHLQCQDEAQSTITSSSAPTSLKSSSSSSSSQDEQKSVPFVSFKNSAPFLQQQQNSNYWTLKSSHSYDSSNESSTPRPIPKTLLTSHRTLSSSHPSMTRARSSDNIKQAIQRQDSEGFKGKSKKRLSNN